MEGGAGGAARRASPVRGMLGARTQGVRIPAGRSPRRESRWPSP
eukprot:CAMPEP_0185186244 /NCGR_PEP_ID=MMETSP1140-20130426/3897_1 /TAXON_ID=298111 /ORGANISM="Pavlova sp., Strain CCMP459" /LENGTH=43 /DNA_ID= /DNA_START= /DNA_END= /DNA_ORIENTATION=